MNLWKEFIDRILKRHTMNKICTPDWAFIRKLEGFSETGYVPEDGEVNNKIMSGVTIGAGFDLGQQSRATFQEKFNLSDSLTKVLLPYVELRGPMAKHALKKAPLHPSKEHLEELDVKMKEYFAKLIAREYDDHSDFSFNFLDSAKQTVILSVGFQYGSLKRCPKFFEYVCKGMWQCAAGELDNFGDAYPTRRKKEAALLRSSLEKKGKPNA